MRARLRSRETMVSRTVRESHRALPGTAQIVLQQPKNYNLAPQASTHTMSRVSTPLSLRQIGRHQIPDLFSAPRPGAVLGAADRERHLSVETPHVGHPGCRQNSFDVPTHLRFTAAGDLWTVAHRKARRWPLPRLPRLKVADRVVLAPKPHRHSTACCRQG